MGSSMGTQRCIYRSYDKQEVIDRIKSGNLVCADIEWGDCRDTLYDETYDWKYEPADNFEEEIEELIVTGKALEIVTGKQGFQI